MDELIAFDAWIDTKKRKLNDAERMLARAAFRAAWDAATKAEREACPLTNVLRTKESLR